MVHEKLLSFNTGDSELMSDFFMGKGLQDMMQFNLGVIYQNKCF